MESIDVKWWPIELKGFSDRRSLNWIEVYGTPAVRARDRRNHRHNGSPDRDRGLPALRNSSTPSYPLSLSRHTHRDPLRLAVMSNIGDISIFSFSPLSRPWEKTCRLPRPGTQYRPSSRHSFPRIPHPCVPGITGGIITAFLLTLTLPCPWIPVKFTR